MELEEMKTLWGELSTRIDNQKRMTDSLIIKMTQANYRNKIARILIPEAMGSSICLAGAVYVLLNLQKLHTWYLLACGISTAVIFLLLPVLSIKAILVIRSVNISDNNFKQSLLEYSNGKKRFVFVQKLSFYLGAILLVVGLPAMSQLLAGKDLFVISRLWLWYAGGFPVFYFLSKWVYKNYLKITAEAETILKELEA
jgi:hypothetical protein